MHRKSVYLLILAVCALLALGVVMLFSTSAFARDGDGSPIYFIKRQAIWLAVGIVVCAIAARLDYHIWRRTWSIWFLLSVVLLLLCYVPPIR